MSLFRSVTYIPARTTLLPSSSSSSIESSQPCYATMASNNAFLSQSQAPYMLGAIISTYCLAIITLVLRIIARTISKAGLWYDDWLVIAGAVCNFHTWTDCSAADYEASFYILPSLLFLYKVQRLCLPRSSQLLICGLLSHCSWCWPSCRSHRAGHL